MEINLLHNYKGRLTNELRLTKGIQIVEDSLGQYLIDNGHALFVSQNVGTPYNIGIDNAVGGAELTVAFALTDEQETPIVSSGESIADITWNLPEGASVVEDVKEIVMKDGAVVTDSNWHLAEEETLRQRYEQLTGRAPHPAMKLETLRAKVAELEA